MKVRCPNGCFEDEEKRAMEVCSFCEDVLVVDTSLLTTREKWLMEKAYEAAHHVVSPPFDGWINDMAADGVTVEMVLAKDAPR
jgi:hypothetical protein